MAERRKKGSFLDAAGREKKRKNGLFEKISMKLWIEQKATNETRQRHLTDPIYFI